MDIIFDILLEKHGFVLQLFICIFLFEIGTKFRKRKSHVVEWIVFIFLSATYFAFANLLPKLSIPGTTALLIFVFAILLQLVLLDASFNRIVFNSIAAYLVQAFTLNFISLIFWFIDFPDTLTPALFTLLEYSVSIIIYLFCYFLFAKKHRNIEMSINYTKLYSIAFVGILAADFIFAVSNGYDLDEYRFIIYFAIAICCLLALLYQFSVFTNSNLNKETAILEQFLQKEQKQHKLKLEIIDLINIKTHDLKKQISMLKQDFGERATVFTEEAEEYVKVYDCITETGNKDLDLVLTQYMLQCKNREVDFNIMADGNILSFIKPADIYSLFDNALSNAVENVGFDENVNRFIKLDIHESKGYVCIEIKNYCKSDIKFENGRPITKKSNKSYHGFGIKSMEFIVNKYNGNIVLDYNDNIFTTKMIIKIPDNPSINIQETTVKA